MPEEQQDIANVPVVYTNNIRLQMSFTDFKVFFGENLPVDAPSEPGQQIVATKHKAVDRICIVISPDIVPALIAGLTHGIQKYQEQFGPLRKPPQALGNQQPAKPATQPEVK